MTDMNDSSGELANQAAERVTFAPDDRRYVYAVVRRIVILSTEGDVIGPESIELEDTVGVPVTLLEELDAAEKRRVIEALANSRGSRTVAAKSLGIPRTTFLNKMKRFGLT